MARKDRRKAARRQARQLTAAELREQAARQRDRDVRGLLAQADSLRTTFSISKTAHLAPVAVLKETRTVTYPAGLGRRVLGADARGAPATVTEDVAPWIPASGDEAIEGPWGSSGGWTPDLVREWLAEAMETLRACPTDHPNGSCSSMPAVVRDAVVSYGWSQVQVRVLPTPAALGRLDVVLQWLFLLDDVEQRKSVVGVAMGLSLRRIARTIRKSHTHVATLERAAINLLVATLNE